VKEVYLNQHYLAGTALLRSGQPALATPLLERAATPEVPGLTCMAIQNLGAAYVATGDYDKALLAFGAGLSRVDWSPDFNFNRAQALNGLGRTAEAITAFQTALRYDPDRSEALNNLAWAWAEADTNLDDATSMARRACHLEPSAGNYDTLGWVYYKRREYRQAREALRHSVKLAPDQVAAYLHLGMTYRALGNPREARGALELVISRDRPEGQYRKEAEAELKSL